MKQYSQFSIRSVKSDHRSSLESRGKKGVVYKSLGRRWPEVCTSSSLA